MMRLARALGCGRAAAVGHMELLWHFAAVRAPQGDIGKWTDAEIAHACAFEGDEAQFVVALVESGWLDRSPRHRLVVHDWHDHADHSVKKWLERQELTAFSESIARGRRVRDESRPKADLSALARGSGLGSGKALASCSEGGLGGFAEFARFWAAYPRKASKQDAARAFAKLSPDAALVDVMLEAIARQKQWPQWMRDDGQFIPYPATWLNGRKWDDEAPRPTPTVLSERGQQNHRATKEWLDRTAPAAPEAEIVRLA
jgi:hypothetical protein